MCVSITVALTFSAFPLFLYVLMDVEEKVFQRLFASFLVHAELRVLCLQTPNVFTVSHTPFTSTILPWCHHFEQPKHCSVFLHFLTYTA